MDSLLDLILRYEPQTLEHIEMQGKKLFEQKCVSVDFMDEDVAELLVRDGGDEYDVEFMVEDDYFGAICSCATWQKTNRICPHLVAGHVFLKAIAMGGAVGSAVERPARPAHWQNQLKNALASANYLQRGVATQSSGIAIIFSLQASYYGYELSVYRLSGKYIPIELRQLDSFEARREQINAFLSEYGGLNKQAVVLKTPNGLENALNLQGLGVDLLIALLSTPYYYGVDLFSYMASLGSEGGLFFMGEENRPFMERLTVSNSPAEIKLALHQMEAGLQVGVQATIGSTTLDDFQELINYTNDGLSDAWLLQEQTLYPVQSTPFVIELADSLRKGPDLIVPPEQTGLFVTDYLLPLLPFVPVAGNAVQWHDLEVVEAVPQKQLYLQEEKNRLQVYLQFGYGGVSVPYLPISAEIIQPIPEDSPFYESDDNHLLHLLRIQRNIVYEQEVFQSVKGTRYGLKRAGNDSEADFSLRANTDVVDFLLKKVPVLVAEGFEIFGEDSLKGTRVNRNAPTMQFRVSSGIDWFDITPLMMFGDIEVKLTEVRKALRVKSRFVKLADGSIGEIPQEVVDKYRHLFELGEQQEEGVRFSEHHLTLLDQLLAEVDDVEVDAAYQERVQRLKSFDGIEAKALSPMFRGELRPYQQAGVNWLHFLNEFGFGGCLADDMGLGKTVQVLAFLQALRMNTVGLPACLIVVPRSLLINWQREAARFTPDLNTHIYFGPARDKAIDYFDAYDLIITTYGTMRQDIELMRSYTFHYVVLDESQAIKNPATKVAKAARLLKSERRLAMTGTPVENSTFELWSQFAFLNPGLLGNMEYFKREFGNPIENGGDVASAELLQKMVYPFILRRTKNLVAQDLPLLTERIMFVDMEPAQRKFYDKTRDHYRAELMGLIQGGGVQNARMKILEGLLRLRQICDHPKLVNHAFRGESAKLVMLMESLGNLLAEGHKVLVFSQFVKMLDLVREELDQQQIAYAYLDGKTQKRQAQVDAFQTDPDLKLFLISLKAGGVGLNLTAADYVIHVDPWWNPAVEMQATDRSHRIGQDKPVFAYKLITKDSVEEKIVELQERKRQLVEQLITTEAGFFKNLSAEDVEVLFT